MVERQTQNLTPHENYALFIHNSCMCNFTCVKNGDYGKRLLCSCPRLSLSGCSHLLIHWSNGPWGNILWQAPTWIMETVGLGNCLQTNSRDIYQKLEKEWRSTCNSCTASTKSHHAQVALTFARSNFHVCRSFHRFNFCGPTPTTKICEIKLCKIFQHYGTWYAHLRRLLPCQLDISRTFICITERVERSSLQRKISLPCRHVCMLFIYLFLCPCRWSSILVSCADICWPSHSVHKTSSTVFDLPLEMGSKNRFGTSSRSGSTLGGSLNFMAPQRAMQAWPIQPGRREPVEFCLWCTWYEKPIRKLWWKWSQWR